MKRQRRKPESGKFEDPLSNYDEPEYTDELEQSICEDEAHTIAATPCLSISADATVHDAIQLMFEHKAGAVVVVDEDKKPVGIFSERDVMTRVATAYADHRDQPITSVMTTEPATAYRTDSPARVLNMMASGGFRHIPIVDMDEKIFGLIGARRITSYLERFFH